MYCAYITRIKNVRKHTNADKLLVGEVFGNSVIVGLNTRENDIGIYFPTDGKLGLEYAQENNLLRIKLGNGEYAGGYLDPEKRNIKTIKLRGERSDGLFMSLTSLDKFCDISQLNDGDTVTVLNGVLICEKYFPKRKNKGEPNQSKKKAKKECLFPYFVEHYDTAQLAYNVQNFKQGDICYITLKMHGTSQRCQHSIKETKKNGFVGRFLNKLLRREARTERSWEYVTGTRRVVLDSFDGGFYGGNAFRKKWHDFFVGKLQKGESVYFEVVGFLDNGQPIMPDVSNSVLRDKEFIKQYGEKTVFSYGCGKEESDIYVYRMTMTNEDGYIVEYPWSLVKLRCEQMGAKYCPEIERFEFTTPEDLMDRVNKYADGADPIGKVHVREGVVVRIEGKEKFNAYKHKGFTFKVLEGIIKDNGVLDIEEAESVDIDADVE